MKKYYLYLNDVLTGPFDAEELSSKNITRQTPLWFEGLSGWTVAGNLPELQSLFVPPPFQNYNEVAYHDVSNGYPHAKSKKKPAYRVLGIVIAVIVFFLAANLVYREVVRGELMALRQDRINEEEDGKRLLRTNIKSYITASLNQPDVNPLGGIRNLKVTVSNTTNYLVDEVKVRLYYYKPNGRIWDARDVTFRMLEPLTQYTMSVDNTGRGVRVEKEITFIRCRAVGLD